MDARRSRADRDALAGLTLGGGSAQCAPSSPGRDHANVTTGPSCRAPAARCAREATRERAQAGASGGASGPVSARLEDVRALVQVVATRGREQTGNGAALGLVAG